MKKYAIYQLAVVALTVLFFSSCLFVDDPVGSEFTFGTETGETQVHFGKADSINYRHQVTSDGLDDALSRLDQTQILGQMISAQFSLRGGKDAQPPGPHAYQWHYSLQTDNYAGYFTLPQNFNGRMPSTYYDSEAFNSSAMSGYELVKNYIVPVLNHPQIDSIPELKAIALLIFNTAAHAAADAYGPIPYSDYKANKQNHPFAYQAVDVIYSTIVQNIDTVVACLTHFASRPQWYKAKINGLLTLYDRISPETSSDKISDWIRYANSLKLRLAIQSVKANPAQAKRWAEEAVMSGVIETPEQQFALVPMVIGFAHPLPDIANSWNDTRLNASLETLLKQYNHPLLPFIFKKNSHPIVNKDGTRIVGADSMYVGLRAGIQMLPGQGYDANFRVAYSSLSNEAMTNMPLYVMRLSEVHFLRAEGALRNWDMGGTAEHFYNLGVREAFAGTLIQKEVLETGEMIFFETAVYQPFLSEYMQITQAKDVRYVDPYDDENNINSLITVGVKWNNGDDNETKLEKIITQKYIAGFPYSPTAWVDLRRTGYPRIFPVSTLDQGDGTILVGDVIRRICYPGVTQDAIRKDVETTAIPALGGLGDVQGTRIWWDVQAPNF